VAKGQQKSNREKKKPKQDKKKVTPPSASPFASSGPRGNRAQKGAPPEALTFFPSELERAFCAGASLCHRGKEASRSCVASRSAGSMVTISTAVPDGDGTKITVDTRW